MCDKMHDYVPGCKDYVQPTGIMVTSTCNLAGAGSAFGNIYTGKKHEVLRQPYSSSEHNTKRAVVKWIKCSDRKQINGSGLQSVIVLAGTLAFLVSVRNRFLHHLVVCVKFVRQFVIATMNTKIIMYDGIH
jgi:hypothetical protein